MFLLKTPEKVPQKCCFGPNTGTTQSKAAIFPSEMCHQIVGRTIKYKPHGALPLGSTLWLSEYPSENEKLYILQMRLFLCGRIKMAFLAIHPKTEKTPQKTENYLHFFFCHGILYWLKSKKCKFWGGSAVL